METRWAQMCSEFVGKRKSQPNRSQISITDLIKQIVIRNIYILFENQSFAEVSTSMHEHFLNRHKHSASRMQYNEFQMNFFYLLFILFFVGAGIAQLV
jgi:hypothetical protein